MPNQIISAIVVRNVNYRDNDRMLTLLSPLAGRVDVLSRGCRRPKSPLLTASELFATGEYVLYSNHDRHALSSCTVHDSFYPLRLNIDALNHAAFFANLSEIAAQPNEPYERGFALLIRALNHLAYDTPSYKALATTFLLHYVSLLGYKPRLAHCVHCGKRLSDNELHYFDIDEGGLTCSTCKTPFLKTRLLLAGELQFLKTLYHDGFNAYRLLDESNAPLQTMLCYTLAKIERPVKSAHLICPDYA